MAVFGVVAATVVTSLHVYLYLRLVRDTTADRRLRRVGKVLVVLLAVALASARFIYSRLPASLSVPYATFSWLWMGLATYLVLTFVTVGFARRTFQLGAWGWRRLRPAPAVAPAEGLVPSETPADASRRLFVSRLLAGSALAVSSGFVGFGAYRAFEPPALKDLALKLPGLPRALDGFRVVHLTDIHVGGIIEHRFMRELVDRCNALKPDLLVITGDMVDGDVPTLGPAIAELRRSNARYGNYFCTGNHEYYSGADEWTQALPSLGATPLRNRFVPIGEPGASFDLIGVDDWGHRIGGGRGDGGYDLEAATKGRDLSRPAVLLCHQPMGFDDAVAKGVGLQLSGHTHGGQFFPATVVAEYLWRYPAGHFTLGDSHIFVSRGCGFWGPPLRLGSHSEIIQLTLLS
jgi:predicted MPP superfamily phosphohydrolase